MAARAFEVVSAVEEGNRGDFLFADLLVSWAVDIHPSPPAGYEPAMILLPWFVSTSWIRGVGCDVSVVSIRHG